MLYKEGTFDCELSSEWFHLHWGAMSANYVTIARKQRLYQGCFGFISVVWVEVDQNKEVSTNVKLPTRES